MRVVTLEPPGVQGQGDHIYRTLQPSLALAAQKGVWTLCGTWLSPLARRAAEQADVLVLCQAIDADFLPLMARRRARGLTTVVEFNDHFLAAPVHSPVARFYANPITQSLALQLATLADGLQLSTPALEAEFGHLNRRRAVFINTLCDSGRAPCPKPPRPNSASPICVRLGWGGSAGHLADVQWLLPALKTILAERLDVVLCIKGAPSLRPLFDWVPAGQFEWHDASSLEDYQSFLQSLHIGLAPLCATPFNDCRSDVKYVEYAMAGVAGIFSQRPAYTAHVVAEKTGLLAAGAPQFVAQMHRLIASPKLRENLVLAAQAQILQKRRGHTAARARLHFWASLRGRPGPKKPFRAAYADRFDWSDGLEKSHRRAARAFVLPVCGAEADLHDGLLLAGTPTGRRHLVRACDAAPDNYLCWLYMAEASLEPQLARKAFERALRLAPASLNVRFLWGQHLLGEGNIKKLRDILAAETHALPEAYCFAPLRELQGRLCLFEGEPQAAQAAFSQALRQNPWYRPPATRAAQLHLQCGQPALAQQLLQDNLAQNTPHWLDYFLLGELARQKGAWRRAKQQFEQARRRGAPADCVGSRLAQSYAALGDVAAAQSALDWAKAALTSGQRPEADKMGPNGHMQS